MVNAVRNLTKMGTDVRQIAKLLQAKAPPGHKLAFINEEEAALLKRRGGSGRITPEGIPSYELDDSLQISGASPATEPAPVAQPSETQLNLSSPESSNAGSTAGLSNVSAPSADVAPINQGQGGSFAGTGLASTPQLSSVDQGLANLGAAQATPGESSYTPPTGANAYTEIPNQPTAPKSFTDSLLEGLKQPKTLASLGIGGTQALLGANAVRKAQNEAAQSKQQLQAMAAPYQQQGQQLQQLANQGQLTPANQQTLQAARAQLAQGAEARGGVGAAQAATQIANLTQSLLANQMNMGIQLQGVGDKIAQGAIQTGIQADQYINQLTSSYAQNIARTVAGAAGLPQQQPTVTVTTPSGG